MAAILKKQEETPRSPGRAEARAVGALLLAGAGLVVLSLALPHPSGGNTAALIGTAAAMAVAGLLSWSLARRIPLALVHLTLGATAVLTGVTVVTFAAAVLKGFA